MQNHFPVKTCHQTFSCTRLRLRVIRENPCEPPPCIPNGWLGRTLRIVRCRSVHHAIYAVVVSRVVCRELCDGQSRLSEKRHLWGVKCNILYFIEGKKRFCRRIDFFVERRGKTIVVPETRHLNTERNQSRQRNRGKNFGNVGRSLGTVRRFLYPRDRQGGIGRFLWKLVR